MKPLAPGRTRESTSFCDFSTAAWLLAHACSLQTSAKFSVGTSRKPQKCMPRCVESSLGALSPGAGGPARATSHNGSRGAVPAFSATWPDSTQLLGAIIACRHPLLLLDSVAARWPATERWSDPAYLERALPVLSEAYVLEADEADTPARWAATSAAGAAAGTCEVSESAEAEESAKAEAEDGEASVTSEASEASAAPPGFADDPSGEMVASLPTASLRASPPPVVYYARWMGFEALAALRADASPEAALIGADAGGAERRYFRLATAGTVSSLHHDTYHNLFVQVSGAKRWWLLPPTAWKHAYSFPKGHDRARQSPRVPVFEWDRRARRAAGAREVVTQPGEVLYVPPYWLHQTATISRTAAVNLWSPSDEARRAEESLLLLSDLHPVITAAASKRAALCVCARAARAIAAHVVAAAAAEAAAEAASADTKPPALAVARPDLGRRAAPEPPPSSHAPRLGKRAAEQACPGVAPPAVVPRLGELGHRLKIE